MKVFLLQLILTKNCNQTCDYCNVFPMGNNKNNEVDLDFLRYILNFIPKDTMIEFCGGEPGIVSNLDKVFEIVYSHQNVIITQIMSNGLVRLKGYDFINKNNVRYREHLIENIDGTKINKFYNELSFDKQDNWRYVVVTTEQTINSLLNNFNHFKNIGFFENIFWYKLLNPKVKGISSFSPLLKTFYNKLNELNHKDAKYSLDRIRIIQTIDPSIKGKRLTCSLCSPTPSIDLETKEIIHCGSYLKSSKKFKYTPSLFKDHLKCLLFSPATHCEDCYIYADDRIKFILSSHKGEYYNLEV